MQIKHSTSKTKALLYNDTEDDSWKHAEVQLFLMWSSERATSRPNLANKREINIFAILTGHASLAVQNEVGSRKYSFSTLKDRTLFCFWL